MAILHRFVLDILNLNCWVACLRNDLNLLWLSLEMYLYWVVHHFILIALMPCLILVWPIVHYINYLYRKWWEAPNMCAQLVSYWCHIIMFCTWWSYMASSVSVKPVARPLHFPTLVVMALFYSYIYSHNSILSNTNPCTAHHF